MPLCMHIDDEVYMTFDDLRQECVLEDSGLIWTGTHERLRPKTWTYAQFEKDVIDIAIYILSGPGHLSSSARADPVKCVRAISAAVICLLKLPSSIRPQLINEVSCFLIIYVSGVCAHYR